MRLVTRLYDNFPIVNFPFLVAMFLRYVHTEFMSLSKSATLESVANSTNVVAVSSVYVHSRQLWSCQVTAIFLDRLKLPKRLRW